jgi:hypothetical protein
VFSETLNLVAGKVREESSLSCHKRVKFGRLEQLLVQCRVKLDSALPCTWSNVELNPTVLSLVSGPMSS